MKTPRPVPFLDRWPSAALAWLLAAVNLYLLPRSPLAFAGFSLVYPALWLTHRSVRGGVVASLLFSLAAGVCLVGRTGAGAATLIAVVSGIGSISIGGWLAWLGSLRERTNQALAEKEAALAATREALEQLATAQEALVAAERAAAAYAERQRWAHEVHDTLAQSFVSLITLARVADDSDAAEAAQVHQRIATIAHEGLREARALIVGGEPVALAGGLADALRQLCEGQATYGAPVPELRLGVDRELTPWLQATTLRVVQEALSNVRRHAQASESLVEVVTEDQELVVRVLDDGTGTGGAPEGTGLTGMRERLDELGGSLTVDPARPRAGRTGTLLEARLPL